MSRRCPPFFFFFFFNDTATTEIYTLSLHDALPILLADASFETRTLKILPGDVVVCFSDGATEGRDRKSTRLNSSHLVISYAVFCLKKKKKKITLVPPTPRTEAKHSHKLASDQRASR